MEYPGRGGLEYPGRGVGVPWVGWSSERGVGVPRRGIGVPGRGRLEYLVLEYLREVV